MIDAYGVTESDRCTFSKRRSQPSALLLCFIPSRRHSFCRIPIRVPNSPLLGRCWTWPYRSCWHTFCYFSLYSVRSVVIQICSVPGPTTEVLRMHLQRIRGAFIVRDFVRDYAPSRPLTHSLSFADRGFYEDWVTCLLNAFYRVVPTPVSHTVELDFLGRILPQVEQARAQLFAATCLRVDHQFVPVLALPRHVRHLSPLRRGTRTRHGRGYQEDSVRFPPPPTILVLTTKPWQDVPLCLAAHSDSADRCRAYVSDQA